MLFYSFIQLYSIPLAKEAKYMISMYTASFEHTLFHWLKRKITEANQVDDIKHMRNLKAKTDLPEDHVIEKI